MRFSILHTSARPEKWREIYDAWIAAADHPERVEYVLCFDRRWMFDEGPVQAWAEQPGCIAIENQGRRCYVEGVNLAAAEATGDVLIVNADDQYPAEHWDTVIEEAMNLTRIGAEFIIWATTGTPNEIGRRIMPMPILSRSVYERRGYVLYPKYESMYADNDFCEMALHEQARGLLNLIRVEGPVFPHRHPYFDPGIKQDAAYAAQNRPEAYRGGLELLLARRANGFKEAVLMPPVAAGGRHTIAVCLPGEWFSAAWFTKTLQLILGLQKFHDFLIAQAQCSNVYKVRIVLAEEVFRMEPRPDLVLWIDDDNLVEPQHLLKLIEDLDQHPEAALVAGWTLTGNDMGHSAPECSCGDFSVEMGKLSLDTATMQAAPSDLVEVGYTGFPLVLMRTEALARVGPLAFSPYMCPSVTYGFLGEDFSFCMRMREAGMRLFVDRRVCVPHLKLRNILDIAALAHGSTTMPEPAVAAPAVSEERKEKELCPE